ncbi:MAG: pilus assembly protein PilP [Gammaproteobacteria bacterium]|jgi:type IV pilus assembly protein PilP|nr:pilus assembly protein PilP [Gammaproteobacteria bacterium]
MTRDYLSRLVPVLAVLLAACSGPELEDLRAFTEQTHATNRPQVEPLPTIRPYQAFTYSAAGLKDPFSSENLRPVREAGNSVGGPDMNRRREPLESFPLDSLKMLGTLERESLTWVIIGAPDGTTHHARMGSFVGQNFGRINRISEERAEIVETVRDGGGNWIQRQSNLAVSH